MFSNTPASQTLSANETESKAAEIGAKRAPASTQEIRSFATRLADQRRADEEHQTDDDRQNRNVVHVGRNATCAFVFLLSCVVVVVLNHKIVLYRRSSSDVSKSHLKPKVVDTQTLTSSAVQCHAPVSCFAQSLCVSE